MAKAEEKLFTKFNFQRNGSGACSTFYSCMKGNLLVTFDTYTSDRAVKMKTIRVVDITQPTESWRGDVVGQELIDWFAKYHKGKRFFDLVDTERGINTQPVVKK